MDWFAAFPPLLICLFVLIFPGWLVASGFKQKGINSLGLAAPISSAIVGISAILSSYLGITWSLKVPILSGVFLFFIASIISKFTKNLKVWDISWGGGKSFILPCVSKDGFLGVRVGFIFH